MSKSFGSKEKFHKPKSENIRDDAASRRNNTCVSAQDGLFLTKTKHFVSIALVISQY